MHHVIYIIGIREIARWASSRISSTPSLVGTRMDMGTARTTWETRGTHTPRLSRKRWCTNVCPYCCGHITPSRLPGFRPPEPRTPHVQRAPTSCNEGSQPTNRHERTRASCISTRTESHTRTARPKGLHTRLSTCSASCIPEAIVRDSAHDSPAAPLKADPSCNKGDERAGG